MDTASHAAHGIIAMQTTLFIEHKQLPLIQAVGLYGMAAVFGAMPDIIGEIERRRYNDRTLWNWYNVAHSTPALVISTCLFLVMVVVPFCGLSLSQCSLLFAWAFHLLIDIPVHIDGNRWWIKGEGLRWEILNIVLTILFGVILFIWI